MHGALLILQYLVSLRVPLLGSAFLIGFPFLAVTKGRTLLLGLFDQTPRSLFLVTLAVMCLSGAVVDNAHLISTQGVWADEIAKVMKRWDIIWSSEKLRLAWLVLVLVLSLPTLAQAIRLSHKQGRSTPALMGFSALGLGIAAAASWFLMEFPSVMGRSIHAPQFRPAALMLQVVAQGKPVVYAEHILALCAFLATILIWAAFGIYGYFNLGKRQTVPALSALLMLVMMTIWPLAAATFYLDQWHVPTLLIVLFAILAWTSGWSRGSDHTYRLIEPARTPQPNPAKVLTATNRRCVIVAAAEGGGIQAAAWAGQVLEGLREACGPEIFDPALRMISAVSGGSVGTVCYLDWLLHPDEARPPRISAAKSSLDEVAWGLAWPDFLRALLPWLFGWMIDRGTALQRAWSRNCSLHPEGEEPRLLEPLSEWRDLVSEGRLPAVVLNSTVVENGFRLLMGTSELERCLSQNARMDASEVNRIGERPMDVSVVTAARLSATFTWVTPAARAAAGRGERRPHLVDGGYYDNYGMATLVEWLDQALTGAGGKVDKVLVLQIHTSPSDSAAVQNGNVQTGSAGADRGWFFQILAPALTLLNVRTSGQIAHNDIELNLLQQKWASCGVQIVTVPFTFPGTNPPLSWHLTEEQKRVIQEAWSGQMDARIAKVKEFLACDPANKLQSASPAPATLPLENVPA